MYTNIFQIILTTELSFSEHIYLDSAERSEKHRSQLCLISFQGLAY